MPPLPVQPGAVADVADVLVQVALGAPQHGVGELAAPNSKGLVDVAGRTLAAHGGRCG